MGYSGRFVATKPSGKLGLFGEKRIRLFPLEHDRTRLGWPPLMAATSNMNLWQQSTPVMLDVNADGMEDLVVGYWKGLKNSRVVLDAYLRMPDRSFAKVPKTTAFDVEDGNRSFVHYGNDLNGDRVGDLILASGDAFLFYPGLHSTTGKKLVSKTPRVAPVRQLDLGENSITISLGPTGSHVEGSLSHRGPRYADLDGDGRLELLTARESLPGGFRIVRFEAP